MRYTNKLIFIILTGIFLCLFMTVNTRADVLRADISDGENKIEGDSDNIYYLNKEVYITIPTPTEELISLIAEAGIDTGDGSSICEYGYELNEENYISYYDGEKFGEYGLIEEGTIKLSPENDDEYNRKAVKFKKIQSYKIYRNTEEKRDIEAVVEKSYESEVYQFIFDKTDPFITSDKTEELRCGNTVNIKITDKSGLKNIKISDGEKTIDSISLSGDERITEYEYELIIGSGGNEVKITATDLADNTKEYFIAYSYDTTPPELRLTGAGDGEIYEGNVSLNVSVSENSHKSYTYYKCEYTDTAGNTSTIENATHDTGEKGTITREYSSEGIYDIAVFSYDAEGNYSQTKRLSFGIDKTPPAASIENVVNGGIYNSDVALYATLREFFFNKASVEMSCTVTDAGGTRNLELSPYEIGARVSKNIYNFSESGKYTVVMKGADSFGRVSFAECSFTIDKTPPVIDMLGEESTYIYNGALNIDVGVYDELSEFMIDTSLIRKTSGGGYEESDHSKIVSIDRNVGFQVPVLKEGEYVLKVMVIDEAGNAAEKKIEFIVDENPPVIGYVNGFNERYLTGFSLPDPFTDYIMDMTAVKYKAYLNSTEISSCDIKADGKYVLQIVAMDAAGNRSEEKVAFIVDNTSPKVVVKGVDDDGNISLNETLNLSLFDDMDYFKKITVNGLELKLKDNRTVDIPVSECGEYEINILASDFAGNETSETVRMKCAYAANPFENSISLSDIKTLTKNDDEIREKFFGKMSFSKVMIICGIIAATTVILGIIAFVDIKILKCDTNEDN